MRRPMRNSAGLVACIALLSLAGCAATSRSDGGIVGSGNRVDCAALAKQDGAGAPTPEECKP